MALTWTLDVSHNSDCCIHLQSPLDASQPTSLVTVYITWFTAVFLNRRAAARYRPWHQLYRAARVSPGICHFSFLSIFH